MEANNVKLARRIVEEGFGGNNPNILDELVSTDYIEHQRDMRDINSVKSAIKALSSAFPDIYYELVNTISQDDLVCAHYTVTGTHKGALGPLQPSGKKFKITLIDIMRFENGKLVEHWGVPDRLGQMEDLGFWPPRS